VLSEGDVLAGKYRIERRLGEGGMGYVVAAVHEQLQQRVAVKFLAEAHAKDPESAARFLREARAAVRIQSEHVGRVLDVCSLEDGSPYIVMEFLHGNDLAAELGRTGTFPIEVAVDYVLQACEAVAEAHNLGLVHRDLKPPNLFLTRRADGSPLIKVLDFGISKAVAASASAESAALTTAQMILGSPAYMSPEQARKPKSVDERTDIWSLGIILYEFLTGRVPFTGDTLLSIIAAAFTETPPGVRELRPDLPAGIEKVIDRCLAKSADERFQTVAELADALAPFAEPHSLPSVSRIRGTVMRRSSAPPPGPSTAGDTLRSRGAPGTVRLSDSPVKPAVHDVETLAVDTPPPSAAVAPKTVTEWGTSSAQPARSRRFVFIASGAALVLLALGLALATRPNDAAPEAVKSSAAIPAHRGEPPAPTLVDASNASAPSVTALVVAPETNPLPSAAASSAASAAPKSERAKPLATTKRNPSGPPPAPATTPAPNRPVNPLDGRL